MSAFTLRCCTPSLIRHRRYIYIAYKAICSCLCYISCIHTMFARKFHVVHKFIFDQLVHGILCYAYGSYMDDHLFLPTTLSRELGGSSVLIRVEKLNLKVLCWRTQKSRSTRASSCLLTLAGTIFSHVSGCNG